MKFTFFVNFKTYRAGSGGKAVKLAKICQKVSRERAIPVVPIVQALDVYRVKKEVGITPWIQHLDWQEPGPHTGGINLEAAAEAGAAGALLNHSEHSMPPGMIKQILKRIDALAGKTFQAMICAKTLGQVERLVKMRPDYLAYEPAALIGGKISVSRARPKAIKKAVKICYRYRVPLIVGAGIHCHKDVVAAQKMGASGVLISSAIVLAKDPERKLEEMTRKVHRIQQDLKQDQVGSS